MDNRTNIVLIGMPGAGKSTLGVVAAKIMGKDFLDVDLMIQKKHGTTLQHIIDERGIEGFIEAEGDVLKSVQVEDTIISTGGSAVYSEEAMDYLRTIGVVVYLRVSYEELRRRLGDLHERGVVMRSGADRGLLGLFEERSPLYEACAELVVDVDGLGIQPAAEALIAKVREARA